MSGSICTLLSGMIAGLVSLSDSRHRVAGVIVTGIMDAVLARSWSVEKHAVWNLRCWKVLLSIHLCSGYPTMRLMAMQRAGQPSFPSREIQK